MFPAEATVKQRLRAEFLAVNIQLHRVVAVRVAVVAVIIHRIVLLPALRQGVILLLLVAVQAQSDLHQEALVVAVADLAVEAIAVEVVPVGADVEG